MTRIIVLFSLLISFPMFAELPAIRPPALKSGDLIAIVFPASFLDIDDKQPEKILRKQAKWLHAKGYRTLFYPEKINRMGYLAGSDSERAKALMDAWKKDDVKAIWCYRGGYGSQRILDALDYEFIKTHPKILIGMSDITALHQAIQQKTGLVTFLAPVLDYFNKPMSNFDDEYAWFSCESLLTHREIEPIALPLGFDIEVLRPGRAQGKLVGGNLSLISSLCGTEWQLNTEGKILILEEVSESVYRIDRMLWQLQKSGLLDRPAAVILASWTDCKSEKSLSLQQVFSHYFKEAPYPVLHHFPSGHIQHQCALPLNTMMEIDTEAKVVQILESAVSKSEGD